MLDPFRANGLLLRQSLALALCGPVRFRGSADLLSPRFAIARIRPALYERVAYRYRDLRQGRRRSRNCAYRKRHP